MNYTGVDDTIRRGGNLDGHGGDGGGCVEREWEEWCSLRHRRAFASKADLTQTLPPDTGSDGHPHNHAK